MTAGVGGALLALGRAEGRRAQQIHAVDGAVAAAHQRIDRVGGRLAEAGGEITALLERLARVETKLDGVAEATREMRDLLRGRSGSG